MKHLKHLLIASTVTALCACNNTKESPVSLQWEMVKNGAAPGFYESSFTITNTSTKPLESDWEIYYTQLSPRQVKVNEDSPVIIEIKICVFAIYFITLQTGSLCLELPVK